MILYSLIFIFYVFLKSFISIMYLDIFLFSPSSKFKKYVLMIFLFIVDSILSINVNIIFSMTFFVIMLCIISCLIYKEKIFKILFHINFLAVLIFISESFVFGILLNKYNLEKFDFENFHNFWLYSCAGLTTTIINFVIIKLLKKFTKNIEAELETYEYLLMTIIPFISLFIIGYIFFWYDKIYLVVIFSSLLLLSNIVIMSIHFTIIGICEKMNRHTILELENENYKSILESQKHINELVHDFKNILTTFDYALKNNSTELVLNQIENLLDDKIFNSTLSGCVPVDAVLHRKIAKMARFNIGYELDLLLPTDLHINKLNNFAAIVGNLLDNAIEGVQRLNRNKEEAIIKIAIKYCEKNIVVKIENPCNDLNIDFRNKSINSEKVKNRKGIGIQSVKHNVRKMNGYINFSVNNNIFKVIVTVSILK